MVLQSPGLEAVEQLVLLEKWVRVGKFDPPIFFVLHNHEQGHVGVINSHADIQLIKKENLLLGVSLRCEDGWQLVTPDKKFRLNISRDGVGRSIFFKDFNS